MRVLFMGTPEFAAASLEALCDAGHTVVGVLTQPDRPAGRGMKMAYSAVKQAALARSLPVWQPETPAQPRDPAAAGGDPAGMHRRSSLREAAAGVCAAVPQIRLRQRPRLAPA